MILANEAVAAFLAGRRRESLYRVHEPPDPQSVEHLLAKLADLEVPTPPAAANREHEPGRAAERRRARRASASPTTSRRPGAGERRFRRSSCARSSRRTTTRATSATPASRARRTPLHLADPPLSRPRRPPRAPARARPGRRPAPGRSPATAEHTSATERAAAEIEYRADDICAGLAPRAHALRARLGGVVRRARSSA